MEGEHTHYYIVDKTKRFENMKDTCKYIGISRNVFRRLLAHGYIMKYNINELTNSSENQRVSNGKERRT